MKKESETRLKDVCVDKNGTIMFARRRATCIKRAMISGSLC